ncbi:hypothetical protein MUN74_01860 [Agromyces endophyticus]|uniref:FtsK/SpoIIIE domain-containing protein n=1 Tax=Agromyces sp. H17E-10 TaxID=2932244 RepID=UPI001FCFAC00|nr:FtsK/SpoIIIE domain-containing protein [Agromyces sp. H17E-10]UOQ89691.1 hypothetical protein MUN74_01860 [Agromyces sp. H17E-10]
MDQTELAVPGHEALPAVHLPLRLPPVPSEPERPGFPLLAAAAPVAGALALWAVTGSMYSLMFAALGPLVAVASVLDARRQGRRRRHRAEQARAAQLAELEAEILARHDEERRAAWRAEPSPAALVAGAARPAWTGDGPGRVVIGRGIVASRVRVEGTIADARDRAVLESAARLVGAPVVADPAHGLAFVGPLELARAAARAALIAWAHRVDPAVAVVELPQSSEWAWAARLPHAAGHARRSEPGLRRGERPEASAATALVRLIDSMADPAQANAGGHATSRIVVASEARSLPPGIGAVVRLLGPGRALVEAAGAAPASIEPVLVSRAAANGWCTSAAELAERLGGDAPAPLPERVALAELPPPSGERRDPERGSLAVAVGRAASGPLELDLVRHGPHAIVGGTTGSGKSEFLLAWLTALARAYTPLEVSFLLVDFKGGAAFEPIRDLPHVTGIVTDLDGSEARRAVESLRAELRHRESVLARAGARDVRELTGSVELARLVIVVDEFQAMIEQFAELGAVIADIAARGRSLGVHLVLASQRPNGVVREQVTANCAIRVSLRVMQRADSLAVVGVDAAASIPPDLPGRGVIDRGDGDPVLFQSAVADQAAVLGAKVAAAGRPRARRPWLDPLPALLTGADLDAFVASSSAAAASAGEPGDGLAFGLVDLPAEQRRSVAEWRPGADGNLLVAGMPGSGRSTVLATIARSAARRYGSGSVARLGGPRSEVWDALAAFTNRLGRPDEANGLPRLIVIDDLDRRFVDWPDDYRAAAIERLARLLREGRAHGVAVVASAVQWLGVPHELRDAFGSRLLLRHPTRPDLLQGGGAGELWRADDGPGAGQWRGHRVQCALTAGVAEEAGAITSTGGVGERAARDGAPELDLARSGSYAVVTIDPVGDAETFARLGATVIAVAPGVPVAPGAVAVSRSDDEAAEAQDRPIAYVGGADGWAANWSLAAGIRERATVLVRGAAAEYRALVGDRALPPLLDEGSRQGWARSPGSPARRITWFDAGAQPNPRSKS